MCKKLSFLNRFRGAVKPYALRRMKVYVAADVTEFYHNSEHKLSALLGDAERSPHLLERDGTRRTALSTGNMYVPLMG